MTRLGRCCRAFRSFYGLLPTPPREPFALFVWEVLSMETTPGRRDAAFRALKRVRAVTPDAMARVGQKKLEEAVTLAGPHQELRVRALRTGVDLFRRRPNLAALIAGPLPAARRALKSLPQLGDNYAQRILLFSADRCVFPVDQRVHRVGRRLGYGLTSDSLRQSARSVQRALAGELPPEVVAFRQAFLYLSHHGLCTCTEWDPTVRSVRC